MMPSVTLPCHMSLFHSVEPSRHGTTTNTYAPQVRPIVGLCELLKQNGKRCAFYYNWEELRDLARPGSLIYSYFVSGNKTDYKQANRMVMDEAIKTLGCGDIDFAFLYLGDVDAIGHRYGWMSDEYMLAVRDSWDNIDRIVSTLSDEYTVLITADHGGHGRTHGSDMPEDMIIPLFIKGDVFLPKASIENASIIDIAPTIAKLFGIESNEDWDGKALY